MKFKSNWCFLALTIFFSLILSQQALAQQPFVGCVEYCNAYARRFSGPSQMKARDNCFVQTQKEGRCGGAPSGTKQRASTKQPAASPTNPNPANGGQQQQQQAAASNQPAATPQSSQQNGAFLGESALNYDALADQIIRQCAARLGSMVSACDNKNEVALTECDPEKNEDMNATMDTIGTVSGVLGTATGSSIAAACSKAASISQAAGAAVAAYRISCNNDKNTCIKSCQDGMTNFEKCARESASASPYAAFIKTSMLQESLSNDSTYQKLAQSRNECRAMDTKIKQAEMAIMNFMATAANASQCKNLTSSSVTGYCQQNPTAAGCSQAVTDCSSPTNASSLVCICQSNKSDPRCGGSASNKLNLNDNTGARSVASNKGKFDGDFGSSGGMAIPEGSNLNSRNKQDDSQTGGAPSLGSGSGGGPGATDPEGSGASGGAGGADVLSGYFSGGGGGSGGFGDSGSGSLGSSDFNSDVYSGLSRGTGEQAPDLSDFLPGQPLDPMAMSGDSLPDGLLGPNVNIWHKINLRYQVVEPTLLKD